jgi:hypothetical protein
VSSCDGFEEVTTGDAIEAESGGGGSGGRIKMFYFDCPINSLSATTSVSGGSGGSTSAQNGTLEMITAPCRFMSINDAPVQDIGILIISDRQSGTLQLKLLTSRSFGGHDFTLEIIDAMGRLVKTQVVQLYGNRPKFIPMSKLPFGIYYLRLFDGKNLVSEKFLWK